MASQCGHETETGFRAVSGSDRTRPERASPALWASPTCRHTTLSRMARCERARLDTLHAIASGQPVDPAYELNCIDLDGVSWSLMLNSILILPSSPEKCRSQPRRIERETSRINAMRIAARAGLSLQITMRQSALGSPVFCPQRGRLWHTKHIDIMSARGIASLSLMIQTNAK